MFEKIKFIIKLKLCSKKKKNINRKYFKAIKNIWKYFLLNLIISIKYNT